MGRPSNCEQVVQGQGAQQAQYRCPGWKRVGAEVVSGQRVLRYEQDPVSRGERIGGGGQGEVAREHSSGEEEAGYQAWQQALAHHRKTRFSL